MIFWGLEPPLADRLEIAIGLLAALTANINRDSKRRPEPFQPKDFMIDWAERLKDPEEAAEPEMQTPEDALAVMERLMAHQNLVGAQQARKKAN